jgi:hypothetical protein
MTGFGKTKSCGKTAHSWMSLILEVSLAQES